MVGPKAGLSENCVGPLDAPAASNVPLHDLGKPSISFADRRRTGTMPLNL